MGAATGQSTELNPRTTSYEFFGPPGALAITLGAPLMIYVLHFSCSESAGGCPPPWSHLVARFSEAVQDTSSWQSLWDSEAALLYLAWYTFCVVAWIVLPGTWLTGVKLRNGGKQYYKMNAFATFLLAMGLVTIYIAIYGAGSFTIIHDKFLGFITAAVLMSAAQAVWCYSSSFREGALLAVVGNTGNAIYDFFIGRELNPTIGSLDLKSFNEVRPGLVFWALIDISMACAQAVRLGGRITDSMWLVLVCQILYVGDCQYFEPAILTTRDITTDGFGFMLSFGDLAWVPLVYSLQARYLVFNPIELGPLKTAAIFVFNMIGYWIFRSSNNEKNDIRNGKNPKNLKFITTSTGSKLLTSGWWGVSRHPNYFGDLIMALAWSLPTGFNTPITYFYVIYFTVLLIHRQIRDDEYCEQRYGKDWKQYKTLVPYRIFPYIY